MEYWNQHVTLIVRILSGNAVNSLQIRSIPIIKSMPIYGYLAGNANDLRCFLVNFVLKIHVNALQVEVSTSQ